MSSAKKSPSKSDTAPPQSPVPRKARNLGEAPRVTMPSIAQPSTLMQTVVHTSHGATAFEEKLFVTRRLLLSLFPYLCVGFFFLRLRRPLSHTSVVLRHSHSPSHSLTHSLTRSLAGSQHVQQCWQNSSTRSQYLYAPRFGARSSP